MTADKPNAATTPDVENLGNEIRQLRKIRGMTLAELAGKTGKSVGFLSQVERNLTRPSVKVLQDIGEALGVHIGWFFQSEPGADGKERRYIVRADARKRLSYTNLGSTDYLGHFDFLLSANLNGELALGLSRYAPGGSTGDDLYTHAGEEAGFVLAGTLELTIGAETFTLEAGDSFSFPSDNPHRYANPGDEETVVLWANTPITLRS
jgi:transcriptional regulator with XRE-family HTH domain